MSHLFSLLTTIGGARRARAGRSWPRSAALVAALLPLAAVAYASPAAADTLIINRPGYHPHYSFEAEPHLLVGFVDPPGPAHGSGFGIGFRGTVKILDNGFVPKINNNVGIGFGIDLVHYGYGTSRCIQFDAAARCVREEDDYSVNDVWVPVVLQWNFFLSRGWSVFGEPGFAFRFEGHDQPGDHVRFEPIQIYLGGRYHFSDAVTLTMRIGYPTFSLGVSFLL